MLAVKLDLIKYLYFHTDRQYTVWLNITNEDFKEEMRDSESLEFLNFAEGLRGAVSLVLTMNIIVIIA